MSLSAFFAFLILIVTLLNLPNQVGAARGVVLKRKPASSDPPKNHLENQSSALPLASGASSVPSPLALQLPNLIQWTNLGDNDCPSFSNKEDRLIFIASRRPDHRQGQIYTIDMSAKSERRITYHSGDDLYPFWDFKGDRIFYSSSTDESREGAQYIKTALMRYLKVAALDSEKLSLISEASEIYWANGDGNNISRLTNRLGFDGQLKVHPEKSEAIFVQRSPAGFSLSHLNLKTWKHTQLAAADADDQSPAYSKDGTKIVWVRQMRGKDKAQLMIADERGRGFQILTEVAAQYQSPSWHPNGKEVIFSSNRSGSGHFDLYAFDLENRCIKRITHSKSNQRFPSFDERGEKIVFSSDIIGSSQIYTSNYDPKGPCLPEIL